MVFSVTHIICKGHEGDEMPRDLVVSHPLIVKISIIIEVYDYLHTYGIN